MTTDRRALIAKMLASAEQSVLSVGWVVAVGESDPWFARPIGRALREIIEARVLLDLCAALSAPAHAVRAQDLRARPVRHGAISRSSVP